MDDIDEVAVVMEEVRELQLKLDNVLAVLSGCEALEPDAKEALFHILNDG